MHYQSIIQLCFTLITIALAAPTTNKCAQAVSDDIASMITPDHGFIHLGKDGIARSYAINGTVVDYRRLTPEAIAAFLDTLPNSTSTDKSDHEKDLGIYQHANGNDVTDEKQIFDPPSDLQPDWSKMRGTSPNPALEARQGASGFGASAANCKGTPCAVVGNEFCKSIGCALCYVTVFLDAICH